MAVFTVLSFYCHVHTQCHSLYLALVSAHTHHARLLLHYEKKRHCYHSSRYHLWLHLPPGTTPPLPRTTPSPHALIKYFIV